MTFTSAGSIGPAELARRAGLRAAILYLFVRCLPFPLDRVPWIASSLPRAPIDDSTAAWTLSTRLLAAALVAGAVWTIVDRRGRHDARIVAGARVYFRYYLAATMLVYGIAKVTLQQFPAPETEYLMTPLGQLTPMNLMWLFMGASPTYSAFGGVLELLAGGLLLLRRTTTLGALLALGVMTDVLMLNVSYDVHVKQLSIHLLLVGAFIVLPDIGRLVRVFLVNRTAPPAETRTPFSRRPVEIGSRVVKVLVIGVFLSQEVARVQEMKAMDDEAPPEMLPAGLYDVEGYSRDGVEVPWLVSSRWRRVVISAYQSFTVQRMDDSNEYLMILPSNAKGSLTLKQQPRREQRGDSFKVAVDRPDPEHLVVAGRFDDHDVVIRLAKGAIPKFPLMTRGLHWATDEDYQ